MQASSSILMREWTGKFSSGKGGTAGHSFAKRDVRGGNSPGDQPFKI